MSDQDRYVPARHVARLGGFSPGSVPKVAEAAGIRIRQVPGLPTRYHLGDTLAMIARSSQVAGQTAAQPVAG